MANQEEALIELVVRYGELLKAREDEAGSYPGDGPTADQVDALIVSLRPLSENPNTVTIPKLWTAFRMCTDTGTAWLFPERDPLGEPMCRALMKIQEMTGSLLDNNASPEMVNGSHRYAELAEAGRQINRAAKLGGKVPVGFKWRLRLAHFLHNLGSKKR
jgi:hypothetical protein